jgi:hypothetical protein
MVDPQLPFKEIKYEAVVFDGKINEVGDVGFKPEQQTTEFGLFTTLTVTVLVAVFPNASVTVTVYVVVITGVAIGFEIAELDKLDVGDHE